MNYGTLENKPSISRVAFFRIGGLQSLEKQNDIIKSFYDMGSQHRIY